MFMFFICLIAISAENRRCGAIQLAAITLPYGRPAMPEIRQTVIRKSSKGSPLAEIARPR